MRDRERQRKNAQRSLGFKSNGSIWPTWGGRPSKLNLMYKE